jgi:hypothetical protein
VAKREHYRLQNFFPRHREEIARTVPEIMKLHGYAQKQLTPLGLLEMSNATFLGTAASIRKVARFLLAAADEMDRRGAAFEDAHIREQFTDWPDRWPDVIVARGAE